MAEDIFYLKKVMRSVRIGLCERQVGVETMNQPTGASHANLLAQHPYIFSPSLSPPSLSSSTPSTLCGRVLRGFRRPGRHGNRLRRRISQLLASQILFIIIEQMSFTIPLACLSTKTNLNVGLKPDHTLCPEKAT